MNLITRLIILFILITHFIYLYISFKNNKKSYKIYKIKDKQNFNILKFSLKISLTIMISLICCLTTRKIVNKFILK